MYEASLVELRMSIEIAHSLAQIRVGFVPMPIETDEGFYTLATPLSQRLEVMMTKVEVDKRGQV